MLETIDKIPMIADKANSIDGFYNGRFYACQPTSAGHRAGLDALLIAAGLEKSAKGIVVDFGAGVGIAGFAALVGNQDLSAILIERDEAMIALGKKSLALEQNAGFAARTRFIEADIEASASDWRAAGLMPDSVDHVIMNPPYNHNAHRISSDRVKASAHSEADSGIEPWLRKSAMLLKPGGDLVLIHRAERLETILAAAMRRFGAITVLPIHSKPGQSANRIVVKMVKGSKAPFKIAPGIVLHENDGQPTALCTALMSGEVRLDFGY